MSEKTKCLTYGCNQEYEIKPDADAHDRNYCPDCLSREYLSLKRLSQNTQGYARPAGKRMRPKSKRRIKIRRERKRPEYKEALFMDC